MVERSDSGLNSVATGVTYPVRDIERVKSVELSGQQELSHDRSLLQSWLIYLTESQKREVKVGEIGFPTIVIGDSSPEKSEKKRDKIPDQDAPQVFSDVREELAHADILKDVLKVMKDSKSSIEERNAVIKRHTDFCKQVGKTFRWETEFVRAINDLREDLMEDRYYWRTLFDTSTVLENVVRIAPLSGVKEPPPPEPSWINRLLDSDGRAMRRDFQSADVQRRLKAKRHLEKLEDQMLETIGKCIDRVKDLKQQDRLNPTMDPIFSLVNFERIRYPK